jgi:UDP-2,3-diacylglucosamine hydrolase
MNIQLNNKKVFFASDFHLGTPDSISSKAREKKIIQWLTDIENEAAAIFLVGDLFDFWFEYDKVVPKGFLHFISKITELKNKNIFIAFFSGNHDLWMKDYFTEELGIPVFHHPLELEIENKKFLVGHGDGLGPGDNVYKILKKGFTHPVLNFCFKWLHPDIGIRLAQKWSSKSRLNNDLKEEATFKGENEWLWQYCKGIDKNRPHDYYVFGHRHLPLVLPVGEKGVYYNLGEWVTQCNYGVFDGKEFKLVEYR